MSRISRRSFIKNTVAGSMALAAQASFGRARAAASKPPNILVILVDEMRLPYGVNGWMPANAITQCMPNLNALWAKSATFDNHFTAACDCSPARASIVTGLYAGQHCLLASVDGGYPALQTAFPTYGSALAKLGYDAYWYGKWHLAAGSTPQVGNYGFQGGTVPDPTGGAGEGQAQDPNIVAQFTSWLASRSPTDTKPFCTTVSLVNPHDIAGFWKDMICVSGEMGPFPNYATGFLDSGYFNNLGGDPCANFEDPSSQAFISSKPSLQNWFATVYSKSVQGGISWDPATLGDPPITTCPPSGSTTQPFGYWQTLLQGYAYLHNMVDTQIGTVLNALSASAFAENTIVVFTSDHGEYGGAHGLHTKGYGAYDEALRVPLTVYDPTGTYVKGTGSRAGLTSAVDFFPMLLTLAGGGSTREWSGGQSPYSYLSRRLNIYSLLQSASAAGRKEILYSTDEVQGSSEMKQQVQALPFHVMTYRTTKGKLSAYSQWATGSDTIVTTNQELEFYDYGTPQGLTEVTNTPTEPLAQTFYTQLFGSTGTGGLMASELRGTLPSNLQTARTAALQAYLSAIQTP